MLTRGVAAFISVIAMCGLARADVAWTRADTAHAVAPTVAVRDHASPQPAPSGRRSLEDVNWLLQGGTRKLMGAGVPVALPASAAPQLDDPGARELPPPPSSLALGLTALAGLGAYQASRSIRKVHVGALPEWYHDAGRQVGHTTPLDLEFSLSALPICRFEAPVAAGDERPSPWWRIRLELSDPLHPQHILLIADPRAPPSVS